jgi:ferredoxin
LINPGSREIPKIVSEAMKVIIDRDRCNGCAACEATVPEVFRLGDDGISTLQCEEIPPELEALVKQAVEECPEEALTIVPAIEQVTV